MLLTTRSLARAAQRVASQFSAPKACTQSPLKRFSHTLSSLTSNSYGAVRPSPGQLARSGPISAFARRAMSTAKKSGGMGSAIGGAFLGAGLFGLTYLGRPDREEEIGQLAHRYDDLSLPMQYYKRAQDRIMAFYHYYADPAFDTLLPDPLPGQPPITLVLEYNQLLTYSEWTPENGYRVKVRKGAREFLAFMAQFYEVVVYTSVTSGTAIPLLEKLQGAEPSIYHMLFRESTRYKDGVHIKDLTCLNRDLRQVVIVDTDPAHYSLNPDNGLCLPPWTGDSNDTTLIDLVPFFQTLALSGTQDVRPILEYYKGKDVVATFKENQRKIKEAEEEAARQAAEDAKKKKGGWGFGLTKSVRQQTAQPSVMAQAVTHAHEVVDHPISHAQEHIASHTLPQTEQAPPAKSWWSSIFG
eukprot:comp23239_c2_seq1/m.37935 comp23239_c2_seq1/g.37935  ORF comp23239_c2_seq1/g.37935 comp23239_c2_seq1/m.37935 type:complete len:412 (-) comp23239_c2_seq1:21-1256(-)